MNEQKTKISEQFGPGDMLTKMEVCQLFCERFALANPPITRRFIRC